MKATLALAALLLAACGGGGGPANAPPAPLAAPQAAPSPAVAPSPAPVPPFVPGTVHTNADGTFRCVIQPDGGPKCEWLDTPPAPTAPVPPAPAPAVALVTAITAPAAPAPAPTPVLCKNQPCDPVITPTPRPGPQTAVYLEDYRPVCDGQTDDTFAVHQALEEARAKGIPLVLPENRECKFTRALSLRNVTVFGQGMNMGSFLNGPVFFFNQGE